MKNYILKLIVTAAFLFLKNYSYAQVFNWGNIAEQNRHHLHATIGAEYGLTAGLGYHHLSLIKKTPVWIGGECSMPAGKQLADDFKIRLGAQTRIAAFNYFQFSVRVQGLARRYRNQSVRIFNFGSDFAGAIGYYKKDWFLALESGFDKAILTNFKHSDWYKKNIYENVRDGWYEPATGGNFYYGFQCGYSFKKAAITFRAGRILQEDFTSQPLLPFYGQTGVSFMF